MNCKNCKTNCTERGKDKEELNCRVFHAQTNADRIRAMTDEELAVWCVEHLMCPEVRPWCETREHGTIMDCKKCWHDWLKQEAQE